MKKLLLSLIMLVGIIGFGMAAYEVTEADKANVETFLTTNIYSTINKKLDILKNITSQQSMIRTTASRITFKGGTQERTIALTQLARNKTLEKYSSILNQTQSNETKNTIASKTSSKTIVNSNKTAAIGGNAKSYTSCFGTTNVPIPVIWKSGTPNGTTIANNSPVGIKLRRNNDIIADNYDIYRNDNYVGSIDKSQITRGNAMVPQYIDNVPLLEQGVSTNYKVIGNYTLCIKSDPWNVIIPSTYLKAAILTEENGAPIATNVPGGLKLTRTLTLNSDFKFTPQITLIKIDVSYPTCVGQFPVPSRPGAIGISAPSYTYSFSIVAAQVMQNKIIDANAILPANLASCYATANQHGEIYNVSYKTTTTNSYTTRFEIKDNNSIRVGVSSYTR